MILYNEIFPEGDITKGIYVGQNEVKFVNIGDKLVYDTFSHVTYDDPIIDISYPVMSRGGRSGTQWVSPTITYQQTVHTWGHSGNYYGSVIEEGSVSDFTVEGAILNSSGAWIDEDGIVYRESLNTTYKPSTWNIMEVTVTATINGVSASGTGIVKMQSNTYTDSGGVTTYSDVVKGSITNGYIPASGGEATATATAGSQDWYTSEVVRTFQTSATEVIKAAKSGTNAIQGTTLTVSKDSKGTDISNRTVAGTKTVTWAGQGNKSATGTLYVYQNANYVTELTLSGGRLAYNTFTAAGTTKTPKTSTSKTVTFKFTSGSTTTTIPGSTYGSLSRAVSYGMTTATGFTLNSSSTGSITASNNKSTSARSTTAYRYEKATWTPSSSYPDANTINSSQRSNSCTVSQSKGYYSYSSWSVSISASPTSGISAKGGSSTVTASASRTYGWNGATSGVGTQNGTVTLSIPTTTGASLSGNTLTWTANTSTTVERSVAVTATCKEDTSKTKSVTVKQNKDTISYYNAPTFDMWWSSGAGNNGTPVSAAGGTSAAPTYSVSQTATYVSGTVRSVTPSITSAVFSLNANTTVSTVSVNSSTGVVTFGSAGTSLQNKEHAEILLTLVSHGKTGTDIGWCYQAANIKTNTYGTPSLSLRYTPGEYNKHKDHTAGVSTPTYSFSQSVTSEYSSGKITTSTITSGATWEFSTTASSTVATINSSTGVVTWPINNGTSSRQILVTAKCISNGISNTTQTYLYQDGVVNDKIYYGKVQWTNNSWNSKGTIIDAIYSIGRGLDTDFTSDFSWIFSGTSGSQLITVNDCFEPPVHIIKSGTYRNTSYSANFEPSTFTFTSMDKNNPTIINLIIR